tara:strand:- start:30 stop:548 length:519 start_codon:yes stop_codon:yes gene_type:complete
MKIAIVGKMCSGKTTLTNFLIKNFAIKKHIELRKISFADKIYELAYDLFNMTTKDRKLLQAIGTNMREIDKNVWVNYTINKYSENVIIDDCRYENEISALKDAGYILIKLNISKELQISRLKSTYQDNWEIHLKNCSHESETSMNSINDNEFNLVISVDGDNVFDKVSNFLL